MLSFVISSYYHVDSSNLFQSRSHAAANGSYFVIIHGIAPCFGESLLSCSIIDQCLIELRLLFSFD